MKKVLFLIFVVVVLAGLAIYFLPVYEGSGDITWGTYCRHDPYTNTDECLLHGEDAVTLADEWWPKCTDRIISGNETVIETFMLDGSPAAPRNFFDGGWYILQKGSCEISHPEG
ncbi:TPA: hypothetical protein DIU27_04345 [Candidatus Collierbacteria bacterium]|uniref:Uncharacterized protein n=1 Tax=Candidatus Collierbacteria bacterium GW2011_GWB2_44_22 TaxID=1618387 RepID=A0A0G1K5X5_9BACT|nr:MAG: hypothetical protein UW44_C0008G0024 [Candidatus Collierbacteria bacterium GW2011_GWB2_44_22]KKT66921.1 MAG: hypothetical protein UW58_C0001G0025 [Candidatus Collierbacteria bacterium GW2011_GWC2_44_30]HCQ31583.1 hypothetical protein [Candidatus Collierbacteria bacterium]